jgi:hypothetical protein
MMNTQNQNTSPQAIVPLAGVIPERLLNDPLPNDAYVLAFQQVVRIVAPVALAASVTFIGGVWTLSVGYMWIGLILLLFGSLLLGTVIASVFVYEDVRADYRAKRDAHTQVMAFIGIAIQNLTINNINVGKARQVNVGTDFDAPYGVVGQGNPAGMEANILDSINATYAVAVLCMSLAVDAWSKNGGKRPRIKPFAFDAVTKHIETGHDRWNAALQLLHDAQVIHNGTEPSWRVLVESSQEGMRRLDAKLRELGYYTVTDWRTNKTVWQRALTSSSRRGL